MFDTCFHLIIFTLAGGCGSTAAKSNATPVRSEGLPFGKAETGRITGCSTVKSNLEIRIYDCIKPCVVSLRALSPFRFIETNALDNLPERVVQRDRGRLAVPQKSARVPAHRVDNHRSQHPAQVFASRQAVARDGTRNGAENKRLVFVRRRGSSYYPDAVSKAQQFLLRADKLGLNSQRLGILAIKLR